MELFFETKGAAETFQLAQKLGQRLTAGDLITLSGELGSGKTVFAKGVAAGLGISEPVTSPTFTIVQEYLGKLPLYHFDVYRLADCWELEEIGYEDYFYGKGVSLVEWPEKVIPLLPKEYLQITIDRCFHKDLDTRQMKFIAKGQRYRQLLEELRKIC